MRQGISLHSGLIRSLYMWVQSCRLFYLLQWCLNHAMEMSPVTRYMARSVWGATSRPHSMHRTRAATGQGTARGIEQTIP
jgi:hypothetical protein